MVTFVSRSLRLGSLCDRAATVCLAFGFGLGMSSDCPGSDGVATATTVGAKVVTDAGWS